MYNYSSTHSSYIIILNSELLHFDARTSVRWVGSIASRAPVDPKGGDTCGKPESLQRAPIKA